MYQSLAPIVIFTYKRRNILQQTIEALQKCDLSGESELYIFSDGYKNEIDKPKVIETRKYIKNISGFKRIEIIEADINKGLANSIIEGVSLIFKKYENVIVLEDDIIVSKDFLYYMNQCLNKYQNNREIYSISGYISTLKNTDTYPYDVFFFPRVCSWGWATWKDRWEPIDWTIKDFDEFKKDKKQIRRFQYGGKDLFRMLKRQMKGEIDSWAIRWCYNQFKIGSYTVYPLVTKCKNIGFDTDASHTNVYNRYDSPFGAEIKTSFNFPPTIGLVNVFVKQYQNFFSLRSRIIGRVYTYLYRLRIIRNK